MSIPIELAPLPTRTYFKLREQLDDAAGEELTAIMREQEHYLEHGLHAIGTVLDDRPSFNIWEGGVLFISPDNDGTVVRTSDLDAVEAAYRRQDGCQVRRVDDILVAVLLNSWPSDPGADCCKDGYPSLMSLM